MRPSLSILPFVLVSIRCLPARIYNWKEERWQRICFATRSNTIRSFYKQSARGQTQTRTWRIAHTEYEKFLHYFLFAAVWFLVGFIYSVKFVCVCHNSNALTRKIYIPFFSVHWAAGSLAINICTTERRSYSSERFLFSLCVFTKLILKQSARVRAKESLKDEHGNFFSGKIAKDGE